MITITEEILKKYEASLDREEPPETDIYDGEHRCPICSRNLQLCEHVAADLEQFFALQKGTTNTGNPKDAVGANKAPLSPVSRRVIHELGLAMLEGECQYWRHNYRASNVRAMVYLDALERHISAWVEGQDIDPKSGLSHLVKAMACLMIVRDAQLFGSLIDDRPPAQADPNWIDSYNEKALAIVRSTEHLVRGSYTEGNREEWPSMSAALNDGPIKRETPVDSLYVPKPGERVRIVEIFDDNPHHEVGYSYETAQAERGIEKIEGWILFESAGGAQTYCRVKPAA